MKTAGSWTVADSFRCLNNKKCDELEIIQPGDGIDQGCGTATGKEAVDILILLGIHHRADGLTQQVGVHRHLAPVVGGLTEQAANIRHRLALAFAGAAYQIEQPFDFRVIGDDFAILADINKIIRVQAIVLMDVDAFVPIAQREHNTRRQAPRRIGGHHGIHTGWEISQIAIGFDVIQ